MARRKGLSKRARFEAFKRDRFTCQYCGRTPPTVTLQADHVIPVSDGGPDDLDNLVTSCSECNGGKSNIPLTQIPPSIGLVRARQQELALQTKAYNDFLLEQRVTQDDAIHRLGSYWFDQFCQPGKFMFGHNRRVSIRGFLKRMTEVEILEAMDIAMRNKFPSDGDDLMTFRYFCGVCWNMIREREGAIS